MGRGSRRDDVTPSQSHGFDRALLLAGVAAQTIGFGMIAALLARLQHDYGFADWALGVITAASFVAAFVGYVLLSRYADMGYARLMLVLGGLGAAGSLVWMAFASTVTEFLLDRLLLGLSESVFVPAARRIALDWHPERPGQELGTILAASVVGFVVGPVLAGLLIDPIGLAGTFIVSLIRSAWPARSSCRP